MPIRFLNRHAQSKDPVQAGGDIGLLGSLHQTLKLVFRARRGLCFPVARSNGFSIQGAKGATSLRFSVFRKKRRLIAFQLDASVTVPQIPF